MFRKRVAEILRRSLKSLDKLDTIKEAEYSIVEQPPPAVIDEEPLPIIILSGSSYNPLDPFDPNLAAALSNFDPSTPFQVDLGFSDKIPRASQGT